MAETKTHWKPDRWVVIGIAVIVALVAAIVGIVIVLSGDGDGGHSPDDKEEREGIVRLPGAIYLAPADKLARNLYRTDLQTGETVSLTASADGIEDFAVSPNGSEIAFSQNNPDGTANIWVLDLNDHSLHQVTNCVEARCTNPAWKPDGTQIAYQRHDFNTEVESDASASRAWMVDLASLHTQLLLADAQRLGADPSWSPTGQRIAMFDPAAAGIYVYDDAAGSDVSLASLVGIVGHWSPDGQKLAYPVITRGSLGSEFYTTLEIIDFETLVRVSLGDTDSTPVDDGEGVWSPDGRQLVVTRRYLDQRFTPGKQLYLVDPVTGAARPLVVDPAYYHAGAHWDSTGQRIIFQRYPLQQAGAHPGVWVYDLTTSELRQVADNAMMPQWLPVTNGDDFSQTSAVAVYPSPPPVTFIAPTPLPTQTPAATATETGVLDDPLPDITLTALDGTLIRLADLKGQILFLNFWATWCAPCQEEMPALQTLQDEHEADGVRVVAVTDPTAGQTEEDIRAFLKTYGLTFTVVLSSDPAFYQQFGVAQIPMTFIIDRAGIVRYRQIGALTAEDIAVYLQRLRD